MPYVFSCLLLAVALPLTADVVWLHDLQTSYPTAAAYWPQQTSLVLTGYEGDVIYAMRLGEQRPWRRYQLPPATRVLRMVVDTARERLWLMQQGGLRVFDLRRQRWLTTVTLPGIALDKRSCAPALAIDGQGSAYVSDAGGALLRVDGQSFDYTQTVIAAPAFMALTATPDGRDLIGVALADGALWHLELSQRRASRVRGAPVPGVCALTLGGDGVAYAARGFNGGIVRIRFQDHYRFAQHGGVGWRIIETPISLVFVHGRLYVPDAQLHHHADFLGDGRPLLPPRLFVIRPEQAAGFERVFAVPN